MLYQTQIVIDQHAVRIHWTPLRLLEDSANVLILGTVAGIAIAGGAMAVPGALMLLVVPALAAAAGSHWLYRRREWIVIMRDHNPQGHRGRVIAPRDVAAVETAVGPNLPRSLGYRYTDSQGDSAHIFLHIRGGVRPVWIFARPSKQAAAVAELAARLATSLDVPLLGPNRAGQGTEHFRSPGKTA